MITTLQKNRGGFYWAGVVGGVGAVGDRGDQGIVVAAGNQARVVESGMEIKGELIVFLGGKHQHVEAGESLDFAAGFGIPLAAQLLIQLQVGTGLQPVVGIAFGGGSTGHVVVAVAPQGDAAGQATVV